MTTTVRKITLKNDMRGKDGRQTAESSDGPVDGSRFLPLDQKQSKGTKKGREEKRIEHQSVGQRASSKEVTFQCLS